MVVPPSFPASRRSFRDGKPLDASPPEGDRDLEAGLPWSSCWVQDLDRSPCVVDAVKCDRPAPGVPEAVCVLPQQLQIKLPQDAKPGDIAEATGPHGTVEVETPADHKPGRKARLRLGAPPEMRIQVPKDKKAGDPIHIFRMDRVKVSVRVPDGLKDGDYFNVAAPVLMVAVPDQCRPGDAVAFRDPRDGTSQWLEARCPQELLYARYFAACIPLPGSKKNAA